MLVRGRVGKRMLVWGGKGKYYKLVGGRAPAVWVSG